MSTQHIVHKILEPGLPGDGFTAAEAAVVRDEIDRVVPPAAGTAAQQLRVTVNGPRWLAPDSVSPLLFDAAGDGVANDYAAIMQAVDVLPAKGGTLNLGSKTFRSNSPITWPADKAAHIDGAAMYETSGVPYGGCLTFADGINGLIFEARTHPVIENLGIKTTVAGAPRLLGTGDGITIRSQSATLRHVMVTGFGRDGLNITSAPAAAGVNADQGQFDQVTAFYNGRDGIHLEGNDSNTLQFIGANVVANRRYGVYDSGFYHNTFIAPHAYGNYDGDYYVDSTSPVWINPYSEGGADKKPWFIIGPDGYNGLLIIGTDVANGGAPVPHYDFSGTPYSILDTPIARNTIVDHGWTIIRNGENITGAAFGDSTSGKRYEWVFGSGLAGDAMLVDAATERGFFRVSDTGTASVYQHTAGYLSFYSGTPVTQRPAIPNTTGANIAALEAEVNKLKQLLRDYNLMPT